MNERAKGYAALTVTSIVWGTTWVVSKLGITEMPALQLSAIRQLIAGLIFVSYFVFIKKLPLPSFQQFRWITVLSLLMFVLANGLSTWGLQFIPTGFSALIGALYPLSVVLIEKFLFKGKPLTALTYIGLILGIGGVAIVFYENAFHHHGPSFEFGLALALIAMLSWSFGSIFMLHNRSNLNPYYGTGWQMLIGSFFLFGWTSISGQHVPFTEIPLKAWLAIFYLVLFGSVIAFAAFIFSLKRLPAALASLYAYINPLIAMLLASVVLDEKLTIYMLWGSVVTLTGVFLVNYSIRLQKKQAIAEPEQ